MKGNIIQKKSFEFALKIVILYKHLKSEKEFIFAQQLLRSSTSIGANIEEGIAGQSRKDFISKFSIAFKEAMESRYWLMVLNQSQLVPFDYNSYLQDIDEIIRILSSIIKTTKEKPPRS